MIWFVLLTAYCVLTYTTVPVAGQCTVSSCAVSVSEYEESLQFSLEEHDHRLETMNQNMCSALEKLEAAVIRTNARGQEDLCQGLKALYYNMSVNLDSLSEKIIGKFMEKVKCHTTQEQEEYLRGLNLSLTLMTVKTEERIQAVNESLSSALQTVNRSLDEKLHVMQVQLSSLINDSVSAVLRELQTLNEALSSAFDKSNEKPNATLDSVKESNQSAEYQANGYTTSGVYRIYVVDEGQRYYANASCDMTTTNGSWTVFQRRKDGSVDFYRGWNDYENGFGNPSGEFWLGNNFLHLLTSKRRYRLRIDLEDFGGEKRYAEYSIFDITSSAEKYRLRICSYSGNAGDSLSWHNGQRFSTKDNDNDVHSSGNCAVSYRGAWWYNKCHASNLNGLYLRGNYSSNSSFNGYEGIRWGGWHHQWYSLKTTEMKISSS